MREREISAAPVEELEKRLDYHFRDRSLLTQALTHSSCRGGENSPEPLYNERLEFLGDAIAGFLVSEALYRMEPAMPEGKLSRVKSNLVSARHFRRVADRLELGRFLRLGPGEEKTGGREKQAVLADAAEALLAALYLDGGVDVARRFVQSELLREVERLGPERLSNADYKTSLQEFLQSRRMPPALYEVARAFGPDHSKTFLVELSVGDEHLASGSGATKKKAEQVAASRALEILRAREGPSQG